MTFRKVHRGDKLKIPATTYNAFIDAALAHQQGLRNHLVADVGARYRSTHHITVRNKTGDDLERFAVVAIDELVVITPEDNLPGFHNEPVFVAVKPASQTLADCVVIQQPIPKEGIGRAVIVGTTVVKIDKTSDAIDFCWPVADDVTKMVQSEDGHKVLYSESGTGIRWAVILMASGERENDGVVRADLPSSQFDEVDDEPTLTTTGGTTVKFDIDDLATTNSDQIVRTATDGHVLCKLTGKIEVTAKVMAKRVPADTVLNLWMIWLQKSVDNGANWSHVADSEAIGIAIYGGSIPTSLTFTQHLNVAANNQIRVRAMIVAGSDYDVQLVSQYQPAIDGSTLHHGPKLLVKYLTRG